MKSAKRHPVLFALGLLGSLFVLFGLVGCDGYLVSICNFADRPDCPGVGTDGVMKPGADMPPSVVQNPNQLPPPNGPERSFKLLKKMELDDAKLKFVGMYDRDKALFLANPPRWDAAKLNLDMMMPDLISTECNNCPKIPIGIDFTNDYIHISGGNCYYFQYSNNNKLWKLPIQLSSSPINVVLRKSLHPFAHPNIDALMFSSKDDNKNTTTVLFNGNSSFSTNENAADSRFFLIGDLDLNEDNRNGSEIIIFSEQGPSYLRHQNENMQDYLLLSSLQSTIGITKSGSSSFIQAAFVDSLNGDAFPDFIYARDGIVYVTSYKGRNWSGRVPIFEHWKDSVISIAGETLKSIIAVELTKDSYPELVIQTDKAVHFYQNIPKAGF